MRRLLLALGFLAALGAVTGCALYLNVLPIPRANVAAVAPAAVYKTPEESDVYVRFVMEGYTTILRNYWQKATDAQLADLFRLSLDKAASTSTPAVADRSSVAEQLASVFKGQSGDDAKRQLATT